MKKLCIYCGSSDSIDPDIKEAAMHLGEKIANHGIELVYGGSSLGIMGLLPIQLWSMADVLPG